MSENPSLVSIITPAYNAERFLVETIDSVRAQTYQHWEHLIVIDQNSTDRTLEIAQNFSQKDPRIQVIQSPQALGAANNRNLALKHAKGEFLAFIDSDDIWFPEKLEIQVKAMVEGKIDFSYHPFIRMSEDGKDYGHVLKVPEELSYDDLLKNNSVGCLTVMLRKKAFPQIEFQNEGWEDMSLWLSLLKNGVRNYGLQIPLAFYRVVNGSRSNNKIFAAGLRWDTYRRVEKLSFPMSTFYMFHYTLSSLAKYTRF